MLLKKTAWFRKSGLTAISFMLTVSISGCNSPKLSIMQRMKPMNINREDLRKQSIRNTHIQRWSDLQKTVMEHLL